MVDKAIFVGMDGAKSSMRQLEIVTNNLANVNTVGFRQEYEIMKHKPVSENGRQTRVYGSLDGTYTNFQPGPLLNTGRDLDIAISGDGFIAVQTDSGQEAYTRAGNFELTVDGNLVTQKGDLVMGDGGLITIPPAEQISIANDGTVSARLIGTTEFVQIDRIKLTNPSVDQLIKKSDGLFYLGDGSSAPLDENVTVLSGTLEGSNVSPIETLTKLIEISRHFEMHANVMKHFEDNFDQANQLLNVSG